MKTNTITAKSYRQNSTGLIALAGNPNVGKSTIFNAMTGLKQHTGNWPGKTVAVTQGSYTYNNKNYTMVDLPGCYSLMTQNAEEEIAADFICNNNADAVVVVCDATCLERGLRLALQTLEITSKTVVCVNLTDEAEKHGIILNLSVASDTLKVPVIGVSARYGRELNTLIRAIETTAAKPESIVQPVIYPDYIENAVTQLLRQCKTCRRTALMALCGEKTALDNLKLQEPQRFQLTQKLPEQVKDDIARAVIHTSASICTNAVITQTQKAHNLRLDRILTGKWTAFPIMLIALLGVFWLTISGANYPSALLYSLFSQVESWLLELFRIAGAPEIITGFAVTGVYRTIAWVVSVMLPPMAVFFPMFTLLEDVGYLPRAAFNLDRCFKDCGACGKQALTMCTGFGCNAAGVIGCRIIDSPRERMIAVITNSLVPCNGRFPILIAVITMFFTGAGLTGRINAALILTAVIAFSVLMTLLSSYLLSRTVLRGVSSSFSLELPPYRKPQIGRVIVRSVFDRTLFVLGRAVIAAAPAGAVIWILANCEVSGAALLQHSADALDPIARVMGLDGVILLAFILGLPANEIVVPVMIMAYLSGGSLTDSQSVFALRELFDLNGWTWVTAVNVMIFTVLHWPCSTTLLTIRKETGKKSMAALAAALPACLGFVCCFVFTTLVKIVL